MSELEQIVFERMPTPKDSAFKGMRRWVGEMYRVTKRNAARRGIPFNLSRQDFRAIVERSAGRCMMTGIEFEFAVFEGSCRRPFAPSLDRIDSRQGYTANNCRLICVLMNLAMNQWGFEPVMKVAEHLVAQKRELRERELRRGKYKPVGFETAREFCLRKGVTINTNRLASRASRLCRNRNVEPVLIPIVQSDGSPGLAGVNAYPSSFLAEALEALQQ